MVIGLGEGIFEHGAAVADVISARPLGAVEVTQSHIIKAREHLGIHIVAAADAHFLAFAPLGAGDELVRQEHMAVSVRPVNGGQSHPGGIGIALDDLLRVKAAHLHRLQEGQQMDAHRAELVLLPNRGHRAVIDRGQVDPRPLQKPPAEGQPLGGIVVAADDVHRTALRQPGEEPVKELHRLGRGHGLVINVATEQRPIRLLLRRQHQNLLQHMALVGDHGKSIDPLTQMQVG